MKISFNNVKEKAWRKRTKILQIVKKIITSGVFLEDRENQKLINRLKNFFPKRYILTTASGHDSLTLALQCLNLKKDDEVIFPVNAYPTSFPVFLSGAKPVAADVDENGQLELEKLPLLITPKTRAVIIVHLYGLVCNMEKLKTILLGKNIALIEDCAQAFGSLYKGKMVGNFGDLACFSFYPTKNLATFGDGGAVVVKNKNIYHYLSQAKSYGEKERFHSRFVSFHTRLSEINAGIVNLYLGEVLKEKKLKNTLYETFLHLILLYKLDKFVSVLRPEKDCEPNLHLLVAKVKRRKALQKFLTKNGIETHIQYPSPVHKVGAFSYFFQGQKFPMSEILAKSIISFPFHAYLTKKQLIYLVNILRKFYV